MYKNWIMVMVVPLVDLLKFTELYIKMGEIYGR